ncbi:MAG: hypothetical protein V4736_16375 [Bdellovibrionota bacterium]
MKAFICFLFFAGVGIWLAYSGNDVTSGQREPAAVRTHYNFSNMAPEKKEDTLKTHIAKTFEIRTQGDKALFQFGYASFEEDGQALKSICSVYSEVTFVFEGEGQAHNGEKPELKVTSACKENGTIASGQIVIPLEAIATSPAGEGDMKFFEPYPTALTFKNVGDSWPKTWYLKGVELQGNGSFVKLNENDLKNRQVRSFNLPVHE